MLAVFVTVASAVWPLAAQTAQIPDQELRERDAAELLQKSEALAQALSATIGTAISPLVGIAAISALGYFRADASERAQLAWYHQPKFWLWAIAILGLVAVKDTVGSAMPLIKSRSTRSS